MFLNSVFDKPLLYSVSGHRSNYNTVPLRRLTSSSGKKRPTRDSNKNAPYYFDVTLLVRVLVGESQEGFWSVKAH